MQTYDHFIPNLLVSLPAFESLYKRHFEANFGEVLPHVFMGELTTMLGQQDSKTIKSVLAFLEKAFLEGDEKLQELVSVSFVENLIGDQRLLLVRSHLGPALQKELENHLKFYTE